MTLVMMLSGLLVLVIGAEALVRGASKLALSLGISPLVIGLTIVAMGTSSPEVAVSVDAALSGQTDVALGNVVGSNIFNVLFILGAAALITPLLVARQLIRQEVPIMILVSFLLAFLAADEVLERSEGLLFLALLVGYTWFLVRQSRRSNEQMLEANTEPQSPPSWDSRLPVQILLIVVGLLFLVLGANWFVEGAIRIAQALGVSELVIGLTLVAAGTSMPEVATSLLAAWRGQRDIAVGNVIGSNIFNILGCLGISALVAPQGLTIQPSLLAFDIPVMVAVAVACLPIFFSGHTISQWEGGVFLGYYVIYTTYLIMASQQHDALDTFTLAMRWVVLPLTILTLAVVLYRQWRSANQSG